MKQFVRTMWDKFFTREIITYVIAGVLTTVVNLVVVYIAFEILGIEELISNTIAWVIAVAFAYVINAIWVFRSKYESVKDETEKVLKFVSGRIASFLVEQAGILIFVKWIGFEFMIIKVLLSIIVMIMNYIVSKLFVFRKKKNM